MTEHKWGDLYKITEMHAHETLLDPDASDEARVGAQAFLDEIPAEIIMNDGVCPCDSAYYVTGDCPIHDTLGEQ
jgi:hypothetical protein